MAAPLFAPFRWAERSSAARRLSRYWPWLTAAVLVLAAYAPLLLTERILGRGDTFAYFYPYWHARNTALAAGQLPLWTPELFTGAPLLANSQLGTFYPLNWLTIPLAAPEAIEVSLALHVGIAFVGMVWLARIVFHLSAPAALLSGLVFAFGGYVGGRVEQINQLQGLAWLPIILGWTITLHQQPRRAALGLGITLGLQALTGHTQIVFITGVGMLIVSVGAAVTYRNPRRTEDAKTRRWLDRRQFGGLIAGGLIGLVLALPQLIPTADLSGDSTRAGGLSPNEATAFSFSPFVIGRGLLPTYQGAAGAISTEYTAYVGVIALGLAVIGALSPHRSGSVNRWTILVLGGVGLFFAFGLYNPVYWLLAHLPGFNLFRVPARWLALYAVAIALLAGWGLDALANSMARRRRTILIAIGGVVTGLAALSPLIVRLPDGTPAIPPAPITGIGWAIALIVLAVLLARPRWRWTIPLLVLAVGGELYAASRSLPAADLVPRQAYDAGRFTQFQLAALTDPVVPRPRFLPISQLGFDPGDRAGLEAQFAAAGLSSTAVQTTFTALKLWEILGVNLPLIAGLPTADGFDGGLLPSRYYSAFAALLLPPDAPRTTDGRLRELLAFPVDCRGACVPDPRWLDLLGVRYLITDKVFDRWHADVAYDTTLIFAPGDHPVAVPFVAAAVDLLFECPAADLTACVSPGVTVTGTDGTVVTVDGVAASANVDVYVRARLVLPAPLTVSAVTLPPDAPPIRAVTLLDTRTGDFQQITPVGWQRVLSSDIELYDRGDVPRAWFIPGEAAHYVTPDDAGTEAALTWLRTTAADPGWDARSAAVIHADGLPFTGVPTTASTPASVTVTDYTPTGISVQVSSDAAGWLVLSEAYDSGWRATVDDQAVSVARANVLFRAVAVPAGTHTVTLTYAPGWLPVIALLALAWPLALIAWGVMARRRWA